MAVRNIAQLRRNPVARAFAVALFSLRRLLPGKRIVSGEDLDGRATAWLARLDAPGAGLRWDYDMERLWLEPDLFLEEESAATSGPCLALQIRILQLADERPALAEIRSSMLRAPVAKLFTAAICQAHVHGALEIGVAFTPEACRRFEAEMAIVVAWKGATSPETALGVYYRVTDGWMLAMAIPPELSPSFRGFIRRIEKAGYRGLRNHLHNQEKRPEDLEFIWENPDLLKLGIVSAGMS